MPSRRPHTKTRHGCITCKAAHVKCDIARPSCGRCVKHNKACTYQPLKDSSGAASPITSPPSSLTTPTGTTTNGTSTPLPSLSGLFGNPSDLVWDDLEVFHHYMTTAYLTMSDRDEVLQVWRTQIPAIAIKQRYLMHSLLGVTALHLAFLHPEERSRYINTAIKHNNIALRDYSVELNKIAPENGVALFLCASLIAIYSLYFSAVQGYQPGGPVVEIQGIFIMFRGIHLVIGDIWHSIKTSEVAPMFIDIGTDYDVDLDQDTLHALEVLEKRNYTTSRTEALRHTYDFAIREIKGCYRVMMVHGRRNGRSLGWPITVGQEYNALLGSWEPMALLILAHYGVILHRMRENWFVLDWGRRLVHDVYRLMDDEWREFMAWPMSHVAEDSSAQT